MGCKWFRSLEGTGRAGVGRKKPPQSPCDLHSLRNFEVTLADTFKAVGRPEGGVGEVGGEASDRKASAKVTKEYHKGVPRYQEGGRRPSPGKKNF